MKHAKWIYGFAAALVLGTTAAYAEPGQGACEQHPNAPFCGGGGGNGGGSGGGTNTNTNSNTNQSVNTNENTNTSTSTSGASATSGSRSDSDSRSYSGGNSLRSDVDIRVGGPNVRTTANGGSASAAGGNAAGGDSASVSNISISDNTDYDVAASSAAAVWVDACQTGMSGQVEGGGFSIVNPDAFCDHINASQAAYNAWERAMEDEGSGECTQVEYGQVVDGEDVIVEWMEMCDWNDNAKYYYAAYHENMKDALDMVDDTEAVAKMDRFFGYLVRPIATIAVLILLL